METGDRVLYRTRSGDFKPATIVGRIDDDIFYVRIDSWQYNLKMHSDELKSMTKLHKLLAGEDDA